MWHIYVLWRDKSRQIFIPLKSRSVQRLVVFCLTLHPSVPLFVQSCFLAFEPLLLHFIILKSAFSTSAMQGGNVVKRRVQALLNEFLLGDNFCASESNAIASSFEVEMKFGHSFLSLAMKSTY